MSTLLQRYTCEIVFHRATNVPVADLSTLSSDPYILATLSCSSKPSPTQSISYRTATSRTTLNPIFDSRWIVSGIPASGFILALHLLDEDAGTSDDRLGKAVVRIPDLANAQEGLKDGWSSGEREYKVHKRHGSMRTRLGTYVAKVMTRGRVRHRVRVIVSVRVLGPAPGLEGDDAERIYTLGPNTFVRHFSPLATRLTSLKSFKANRLQLTGPVPSALRHRYVGFAPFVKAMFRARGIEGIILNRVLHKQHRAIYKWDKNTILGVLENEHVDKDLQDKQHRGNANEILECQEHPNEAFAKKFLDMAEYGTEGRIFTYVIMLDGEWRFTETGEEFAINLLSKHTMHADVSLEIAYSGEFFVRQIPSQDDSDSCSSPSQPNANGDATHRHCAPSHPAGKTASQEKPDRHHADALQVRPSTYELVIDNDSGTYRPRKDLLPLLEAYLARPTNLGALGRVRAMDGFDETLKRWKEQRKEEKRRARGAGADGKGVPVVRQASISSSGSSSVSSEDEDAIMAAEEEAEAEKQKQEATANVGGKVRGKEQERKALEEDGRRAEENCDDDDAAREERNADAEAVRTD